MSGDERPAPGGSGGEDGSYTARPANEPPSERVTRDEDEEAVERTDGEHEITQGGGSGSRGQERYRRTSRGGLTARHPKGAGS